MVGRARDGGSCWRDGGGAGGWVLGVVVVEGWNNAALTCHVSRDIGRPICHRVSTTADIQDPRCPRCPTPFQQEICLILIIEIVLM